MSIEYRMRCFLGVESVRADNALALAAEVDRFDELRKELFEAQPEEGTGRLHDRGRLTLGRLAGLTGVEYSSGVEEGRYETWVLRTEETFQRQDPKGTPAAWLDGEPVDGRVSTDRRRFGALLGS